MKFIGATVSIFAAVSAATGTAVHWGPCADNLGAPLPVDCGRLAVPLDYTQHDGGEGLVLELLRAPALKKPAKGSILINFGGPGVPCRETLAVAAPLLHMYTPSHTHPLYYTKNVH